MKAFWILSLVMFLTGCTWPSDVDQAYDRRLAQNHFRRLSSDDFHAQSWAKSIEPNTLQMMLQNGTPVYVFYDTHVCHCAFVGNNSNYLQVEDFSRAETAKTQPESTYVQ
ncbi:hypothetical protein [Komagataeibacter diospyri]|uniref:hypothetical protein n=1 Tax=Komagataeibacter diospyri TaxID=1932662 RepID=UPI003757261D